MLAIEPGSCNRWSSPKLSSIITILSETLKRRNFMLWTIVVILVILWLLGYFGRNISPSFPQTGSWIHTLLVIAVILIILNVLGVI
jgi:hypothetical protein